MKTLFKETDPLTGVTTEYALNGDGQMVERTTADNARPHLEYSTTLAKDEDYTRHGIKESYWHVGHVPPEVCVKWLAEGFNVYTAHPSEVIKRLRQPEYAYLRTTNRKF